MKEWGLSSGSLLQVEDEGQGWSINLVLREEPDLDEQLYPSGFKVEAGAGAGEEAATESRTAFIKLIEKTKMYINRYN